MPTTKQGSHWIRDTTRERIYARDKWRCIWCQCEVRRGDRRGKACGGYALATLDHFIYGCNKSDNLLTASKGCNVRRGEKRAEVFALECEEPCTVWVRVIAALCSELPKLPRAAA